MFDFTKFKVKMSLQILHSCTFHWIGVVVESGWYWRGNFF